MFSQEELVGTVHVKALVTRQPPLHLWGLVGRVVVHDQMELFVGRGAAVNEFEKANPVPTIVGGHADVNHASVLSVHGGKQRSGAMPLVVVGHGPTTPLFPGQAWLGAIQSLDLTFFVNCQ
jgi:hypothetical protein